LSERVVIHRQHGGVLLALLVLLLVIAIPLLFIFVGDVVFNQIGFTPIQYALILTATLVGSAVNIPLVRVKSIVPLADVGEVRVFWRTYRIPRLMYREVSTVVAINFGGAVIPILVSIYLVASHSGVWLDALIGTLVTSVLVHMMARKVRGVGIVTPSLLPPIIAALIAYVLMPGSPAIIAYVSGTLGTLIGADLLNMHDINELGASFVSIGGAGTFDGVFLTGLLAVLLVSLRL
jgi:uncharacterized membrane protein